MLDFIKKIIEMIPDSGGSIVGAIAIVIENGGWGAQWAAPIASLLIEKYINDSISRPAIEERMLKGNLIESVLNAQVKHSPDSLPSLKNKNQN